MTRFAEMQELTILVPYRSGTTRAQWFSTTIKSTPHKTFDADDIGAPSAASASLADTAAMVGLVMLESLRLQTADVSVHVVDFRRVT